MGETQLGAEKERAHRDTFNRVLHELAVWNETVNLTRIPEDKSYAAHIVDALTIFDVLPNDFWLSPKNALDLGTGAGFPGLPLAISSPMLFWTLLDSTAKKLEFIRAVVATLDLKNVAVVHDRAEQIGRDEAYRECFDLVVSRAVAELEILAELALPLVRVGGIFVAYKATTVAEEIPKAEAVTKELGGGIITVHPVTQLPELSPRCLVVIKKETTTPARFPRARVRARSK